MSDPSTPRRSEGRYHINSKQTNVTVSFVDRDGSTHQARGRLADLSLRGIRVDVNCRIQPGQVVDLLIEVPCMSMTLRRSANVRWQQPRDVKTWWTGCELAEPFTEAIIEQLAAAHVLNRRRDARYEVDCPVKVRTELSNEIHDTQLINYSKGGFCLLFSERIELPHDRLMLLVTTGDKARTIAARVMWTKPTLDKFAVGCAFSNLDGFVHLRDYAEPARPRRRLMRPHSATISFTVGMALVVTIALQANWLLQTRPEFSAALRASWADWVVEPLRQTFQLEEQNVSPPSPDNAG